MSGYHMRGILVPPQQRKTDMSENDVVGSKMPAKNNFGQNGFQGASSAPMDKQPTISAAFKPKNSNPIADVKAANIATFNEAERKHQGQNVPAGYGMRDRTSDNIISVPHKTDRRKD